MQRGSLRKDAVAGLVLGVESVPDGLASGLLAGVNPVAGLYAYLFGMAGAAFFTSSSFMAVQATGAMALIVNDTDLASRPDPERALFTLAILTGVVMLVAGLLGGGRLLRFVPTAVMTGFVTAVGVNIVLGQLGDLTGAEGYGENRLTRAIDLVLHVSRFDIPTLIVGLLTMALILLLTRTPLRSLGLVVAVAAGSVVAWLLNRNGFDVVVVADIAEIPAGLPMPTLPDLEEVWFLIIPAMSLAFVGIVQGAAVSAGVPNADGRPADANRDFVGQGVGNLVSGLFQGMPVGGSMSASALYVAAGARTRLGLIMASSVMAITVLFASGVVSQVAMPSLAALLIVIGIGSIKPAQIRSVANTGVLQITVMAVTFFLTLIVPLQFAVLIGVGLGIILFVAEQSNQLRVRQIHFEGDGRRRESAPAATIGENEVVVVQPYGSMFFANAPNLAAQLPRVDAATRGSVVILRLRGIDQIGLSHVEVLRRYATELDQAGSRLEIIVTSDRVGSTLAAGGLTAIIGEAAVHRGTEWQGDTLRSVYADALERVGRHVDE
ncbi:SulP family inorganic anion transporter [Agromyces cerinus]|uniref:Sulfate permease, SulP family n=1 Tax=Agromyces cerinus subsp. cerinus TaxID=232089 RepID=A0A1N6DW63_9MICO|nr:SulP family inorganic anion transporter [Agromyces cerinus]SIN75035.1 sulfate permease, SulP family [Agromyces cerinus subsp. cerinus]